MGGKSANNSVNPQILCKKNIHFLRFISPQLCPLSITFKFSETDAHCWQILAMQPLAPNATRDGQAPIKLKKQWDMKVG